MASSAPAPEMKKTQQKEARKSQEARVVDASSSAAPAQPTTSKAADPGVPTLRPWMRTTVAMRLKKVDGREPDMSEDVFAKKMVLDQGFSKAETLSIFFFTGIFYVTFASFNTCRRYWEAVKAARPESPFSRFVSNCLIQREERRVTVSILNPYIPGKDIATFLARYCTVVKEPSKILSSLGFWTGKWSVVVRLNRDESSDDGFQHLPQAFSLGDAPGFIYYPDMPQICRRCSKKGHQAKDCSEDSCRVCRVPGHGTKVKAARPESPFSRFVSNCLIQREERRVTVSILNPYIPGKDIATFLARYCTVVKEPSKILSSLGFWTGKWSVVVRLNRDESSDDGFQHLPQAFSLGDAPGFIYYPDMPQICRRCSKKGHQAKDCSEDSCRVCRVPGHGTKDCPKAKTCNLCGHADHSYRACPQREKRTWASVVAKAPTGQQPAVAQAAQKPKEKETKKKEGKRTTAPNPPPTPALPTPSPSPPSPPPPSPSPPTPTEESLPYPIASVGPLSPAPTPTLPPHSPNPAALTFPPAAVVLSLEDFPPLVPTVVPDRKRKVRDSPSAETSKKKIIEVCEDDLPEE
ncbi:uncharacterized protein, partial [Dendropsophus ebraccatus]|uniref:uncharacterized protein n=1 Tax=Dendropsophus ebraccatus TaxID=150705 RepID=UPI0038312AB6